MVLYSHDIGLILMATTITTRLILVNLTMRACQGAKNVKKNMEVGFDRLMCELVTKPFLI